MKIQLNKTLVAALAALACAGAAQAQFEARDLDGNGTADAYYDTRLDISWLADANAYATQGGPINTSPYFPGVPLPAGELRVSNALSWVDALVVGSYDGWRLPQRLIPETYPEWDCPARECAPMVEWPSELSFMAVALGGGNGPFGNVQNGSYIAYNADVSWFELRNVQTGSVVVTDEFSLASGYAWAVHDGDVGLQVTPVPEPSTYALMMCGLAGVALRLRRKARK